MRSRPVAIAQIITGIAAAMALLYFLAGILIPLVIAFVLVVLVDAVVTFINARWPGAPKWVVSAVAGLVVILSASGGMFVLAQGAVQVVQQGPALIDRIDVLVRNMSQSMHLKEPLGLQALVGSINIPHLAGAVLETVQGIAGAILLIVIYFGFMVAGRRRISRKIDAVAGTSERKTAIKHIIERITADIRTYLWVQAVTGVFLASAAAAVMLIVGLNNVLFWTVIFFLLTFIPNIGVTIGSIAPALFALLQFPTLWQGVVIFAVIQAAAFIVGNLIYPRMQADTQNIDPVTTIVALSLWTFLWGIPGAFLAVPMTLMLMMAFAQFEATRWVSAALSNDGKPTFRKDGPGQ
ncbi:MAG TPA: AI-2E family transporter [Sphingomicrobium sp.]|nr:AI-2E family transporter [Sphingomicrobium sp.]